MNNAWKKAKQGIRLSCACALLAILASPALAASSEREAVYQQARSFLQEGNAAQAYALLSEHEADWSGDDAFDYLLGVAALDSGESGEAIFSLQRLVARRPAFAGARMDLARAYFDIGDNELARIEFDRVLADNPPPKVEEAVRDYKRAIDARARSYKSDIQYSVDLGFGYDSNSPAATEDDVFLTFVLSPNNLEQSSAFANAAFGAMYNRPLSPESQILLNARIDHRVNPSTHFVDASNVDLGVAWSWKQGDNGFSIAANRIFSWLDRDENKTDTGINATYTRQINKDWSLMAFARAGQIRFEETALEVQDVDQVTYGVSLSQSFSSALLSLTLTGGQDDAEQSLSPFSADNYGISLSNSWFRPGGKVYFVEASFNNVEYDDQFFGLDREDDLLGVALGAPWPRFPMGDWSTTFRLSYSEKDSTVSLYEFDRLEAGLTLQKLF